jgi:hypothetical protein
MAQGALLGSSQLPRGPTGSPGACSGTSAAWPPVPSSFLFGVLFRLQAQAPGTAMITSAVKALQTRGIEIASLREPQNALSSQRGPVSDRRGAFCRFREMLSPSHRLLY